MFSLGLICAFLSLCLCSGFSLDSMFPADSTENDVLGLLSTLDQTTTVTMLRTTGLAKHMSGQGPFTVFGPTNKAFDHMPFYFWVFYMGNATQRMDVMKYHVVDKMAFSKDWTNDYEINTELGIPIRINKYKNGKVTASGSLVLSTDHKATNGAVHELSKAMLPPYFTLTAALKICPAFSQLYAALKLTGLDVKLNAAGPWTMFAPSNKAINALAPGLWKKWSSNKETMTGILLNHVIKGTYYTAAFDSGSTWQTVSGKTLTITEMNGDFKVDDIQVAFVDLPVRNGVMHVMDTVIPPS